MRKAVHLHGLLATGTPDQGSAPLHRIVALGPFDAILSDLDPATLGEDQPPEALAAAAMRHHHILQAYCADHALLPLQFGAVFSSIKAVRAAMQEKAPTYQSALRKLADHREFSVTLEDRRAPLALAPTAPNGRAFLNRKRSIRDRRRDLTKGQRLFTTELHRRISDLSAQPLHRTNPQPGRLLDVSLLASRVGQEALRHLNRVAGKQAAGLEMQLRIVGPWPAYHFDIEHIEKENAPHVA